MSANAVHQVVSPLISDLAFRQSFNLNRIDTLSRFALTTEERQALLELDVDELIESVEMLNTTNRIAIISVWIKI